MSDIVEFLRERYDEIEAAANAVAAALSDSESCCICHPDAGVDVAEWRWHGGTSCLVLASCARRGIALVESAWAPDEIGEHVALHDPAEVMRDIAAKRKILDLYEENAHNDNDDDPYEWATGRAQGLGEVVRLLTQQFADHPDFDEQWRPT